MEKELVVVLGNEREKICVDLDIHSHIFVVAEYGRGTTTFLNNVAEQVLKIDEEIEMYILSGVNSYKFNNEYKNIKFIKVDELDKLLNKLMKREYLGRDNKRVILLIDGLSEVYEVITEECKGKIDYLIREGRELKVNLFMSSINEDLIKTDDVRVVMAYGRNNNRNRELRLGEFIIYLKMLHRRD